MRPLFAVFLILSAIVLAPLPAKAQEAPSGAAAAAEPPFRTTPAYPPFTEHLLFTDNDILRIKATFARIRTQALDALQAEEEKKEDERLRSNRYVKLSGITRFGPERWMIWINGQRVTPNSLLPEIIDINVHEDYIDLKWFDAPLKKIIKIRLRPNQAYDIATGLLLPGQVVQDNANSPTTTAQP